jgi:hypothetical protein
MNIQRRALYNSLRMNWLMDPTLEVEPWQVENYREIATSLIFSHLRQEGVDLDKDSFTSLADNCDTPEELTETLFDEEEENLPMETEDKIYLLIFELWRRLETDKPCLSVFCDELDHQIYLYDHQQSQSVEDLQDALANLQVILDENTDQGAEPIEVLESVSNGCANDIETFLYDFISEQIENDNYSYASELLDSFTDYVHDVKWFELLRVRLLSATDGEAAKILVEQLAKEASNEEDLSFSLEVLSEMVQEGQQEAFVKLAEKCTSLLEVEEDFQDLMNICIDYYSCLDEEDKERQIKELLGNRTKKPEQQPFKQNDTDLLNLLKILHRS